MRVLVTRPQPGAARTAERLRGLGYEPVVLPLTEIVGLEVEAFAVDSLSEHPPSASPLRGSAPFLVGMEDDRRHAWHPFATPRSKGEVPSRDTARRRGGGDAPTTAVAVTSANAIRHAPTQLQETLRGLPCYAVGGETAAAARAAGFSDVHEGPGSAAGLAGWIIHDAEPHAAIVYLCGRVRLTAFEKRLGEAGLDVRAIETYDTLPILYARAALQEILGTEPIGAALLYSAGAAELFASLASVESSMSNSILLCLSPRVADRLAGFDASRIRIASEPTEEALLALL